MWPFKKKQPKTDDPTDLLKVIANLDRLQKHGLLLWNEKERRLFIAEPLAVVMLNSGTEGWRNFLHNVFLWTYYNEAQEAWETAMISAELKAVRRAKRRLAVLTKADSDRIRRAARKNVAETDQEPPEVREFEFFVVLDGEDPTDKRIHSVGTYDPETRQFDVVSWDAVADALRAEGVEGVPDGSADKQ